MTQAIEHKIMHHKKGFLLLQFEHGYTEAGEYLYAPVRHIQTQLMGLGQTDVLFFSIFLLFCVCLLFYNVPLHFVSFTVPAEPFTPNIIPMQA